MNTNTLHNEYRRIVSSSFSKSIMASYCLRFLSILIHLNLCKVYNGPSTPCDPLTPQVCSYPFPNDYWLIKDDDNNPIHLNFSEYTFPIADLPVPGVTINPFDWNKLDGFSPIPAILTYFDDLSISNCAPLWNISQSTDINSPIILLDPSSNTRIPHWTELDHSSDTQFTNERNRSLMIWPYHRLTDGKNYIVALRYLQTNRGKDVEPSQAFKV